MGLCIEGKLLIVVRIENVGATFMAENSSSGVRIRHVDTEYDFIHQQIKYCFIILIFVKSNDNETAALMKKFNNDAYKKHEIVKIASYEGWG